MLSGIGFQGIAVSNDSGLYRLPEALHRYQIMLSCEEALQDSRISLKTRLIFLLEDQKEFEHMF